MVTSIADWIRELRGDLTRSAFAEKLSDAGAGVDPETIYRWERGSYVPQDWRLLQLMNACAVPIGPSRDFVFNLARQDRLAAHTAKVRRAAETSAENGVSDV